MFAAALSGVGIVGVPGSNFIEIGSVDGELSVLEPAYAHEGLHRYLFLLLLC